MGEGPILITGSDGLIGRNVIPLLRARGLHIRGYDRRSDRSCDLLDRRALSEALKGVSGVVHLGGVSRVVWGQRSPELCIATNEDATSFILDCCASVDEKPWVVYASSREVYGQSDVLPVHEDFACRPMNVYARSKQASESHCQEAVARGVVANVVRFSSVYGDPEDHPDRVTPAFARASAFGGDIFLEGGKNVLDFTFIRDVVRGLELLIAETLKGRLLPPIHLVSGVGTELRHLAELARTLAEKDVRIIPARPRDYDVSRFVGNPQRAYELLGWRTTTSLEDGFRTLVAALRTSHAAT